MKNIIKFDQLNEANSFINCFKLKIGDIIIFSNDRVVIMSQCVSARHGKNEFTIVKMSDLEKLKKGDRKAKKYYTARTSTDSFEVVGKLNKADLALANTMIEEVKIAITKRRDDNLNAINYERNPDSFRAQAVVTAGDGSKIKVGDRVMVKFSNGNFPGTVKSIGTNKEHQVMILFGNRSKAKGVSPHRILKKL